MIEIKEKKEEKAILVAVKNSQTSPEKVEEYLSELEMLAKTAGAETILKIVQERSRIDSAYYIGKGKAEEIAELAEMNEVDLIIFDDDLSPNQVRNLEKLIERKIIDRSGLILDIFALHARTKESKTQVELAQLQYILPRLTRMWTHLSKQHGGIGTKGPGETQIETDRRLIRTRIAKLKETLKKIESQQITKSQERKNFLTASLVGYTNAGKSTLLNLLTESDVLAENKLFATLDSTTRIFDLESAKKILISDTVGFIRKLPHHLVASFKSTLNVVKQSDVILNVIDITNPFFEDHIAVVNKILNELDCDKKQRLWIFNKVDALENKSIINMIRTKFENPIFISSKRGINISELKDNLLKIFDKYESEYNFKIRVEKTKQIAMIHSLGTVLNIEYDDEFAKISFRMNKLNYSKLLKSLS